ncbi:MAG: Minf_1886 family protein [Planctomycetota bacterium]
MSNELTNSPLQAMRRLLKDDARYKYEAYQFVREALQFAHENLPEFSPQPDEELKSGGERSRGPKHITGQQLCEACRKYAVEQYGYLARMVLSSWGICSTSDFGEIVYNLIRIEQMKKSDSDRREDFNDVYSFDGAFEPDFQMSKNTDDLGVQG